ncbi:11763_t:CDS:10, partial [Scutellospora calospora]
TSQNKAFNRVKLVYLDKKIDYWKSYAARHALAVLHYNEGYTHLFSEIREIYCGKPFESEDIYNISMIESSYSAQQKLNVEKIREHNQARSDKYTNEYKELVEFDFDKELVPYKEKVREWLLNNEFYPSFALLIVDFNVTIRCIGCHIFKKCFKDERDNEILYDEIDVEMLQDDKIENEMQQDAIENEILVDKIENEMQQSEINQPQDLAQCVKIIAENIFKFKFPKPEQVDTIKYYIEDEKDTLIIMKTGTIEYETKIFEEIALGFICLLYVTPEKLLLKQSLMKLCTLTATLSYDDAIALRNDLNIDKNNFRVVRENDLSHPELCFSDCFEVFEVLDQKIEKIIDVYNGQLLDSEKNNVIKRWTTGQTHLMITISAFRMGIDMPDVHLDIRTNYSVIANNKESNEDYDEQTATRELYLAKARHKLFELVSQYHTWPSDLVPPTCNSCDNCIRRVKDNVKQDNALTDILDLLNVVKVLCENNNKAIIPLDVVEVFCCLNNARLQTELALADLVCHNFVKQSILLERKTSTAYLICSVVIEGIIKKADLLVLTKTWLY